MNGGQRRLRPGARRVAGLARQARFMHASAARDVRAVTTVPVDAVAALASATPPGSRSGTV